MSDFIHIEPAHEKRRDFARWALAQTPKLQTSSSTGTDVPIDIYPDVPPELLEGGFVDGFPYDRPDAPQAATTQTAKATVASADPDAGKAPQKATQTVARKPRKRAPRRPRKTGDGPLTAEKLTSTPETGPDSTDTGRTEGTDSASE